MANVVSICVGMVEIVCYSAICFGFSFIQSVMESEGIFGAESCPGFNQEDWDNEASPELCVAAKQQFNSVFTCASVASVSSKNRVIFYNLNPLVIIYSR